MNKPKSLLIEICWLLLAALINLSILILVFGKNILQKTVAINLHDTYFVTQSLPLFAFLFIVISFVIYYVKEHRKHFQRKAQNIIIIIFGLLLILSLTRINGLISLFKGIETSLKNSNQNDLPATGWTVYPPLGKLEKAEPKVYISFSEILSYSIMLIQVFIIYLLVKLGYKWGMRQNE
ncbi:hypothetical protein DU508_09930 [Pedobacter chinensis]|uniref:Uncharacterized protein n=1 Tax=Pedobacter chinensis TaxID=2282421 RepID=A0A369Q3E9_9SPHI|nr:hypothetical protein [Pedobacter chinensis]RDC57459.1 hypothetical protein DU508_09930 [Pedobacter chinensis]